jgi:predicted anti-sigma-YlaC factor YlaD
MKNQTDNNACLKYEAVLEDYLEGQLNASDLKDLGEHLKSCAGCREALALAEGSVQLLRIVEPQPAPGPAFARVVMARIQAQEAEVAEERAGFWRPLVSMSWRFAATAAVALVLLLTYDVVGNRNLTPGGPAGNQTEVQAEPAGIFTPEPVASPATRDDVLLMVADTNYGSN